MKIDLDERVCPVCGIEHHDHIINGKAEWFQPIWEAAICDACDLWAMSVEGVHEGAETAAGGLILLWGAGIDGPPRLRGRA